MQQHWTLADEQATDAWAAGLAQVLPRDFFFVSLKGGLGAGKTHTVRAVLRALGETGAVRSPTYTLLEDYQVSGRRLLHWDLYRLADAGELEHLGVRDLLGEPLQLFIEWLDKAATALPQPDLEIALSINPLGGREVVVTGMSPAGCDCLQAWAKISP